ncbi:alpha-1,2-fucosyltransferase super family [Candidatus Termititenax persephonae]|uniref:Alpha-1,2-fucosyltransferase super family n=1 Tax=Candidatus Termititenax persephonae TaxID=2218525 RepID=A0A388THM7_9BACT|nr:alpha-1,2-fucosyltransferase super family [Candidatus Termititenax persephonae]
MFFPHQKRAVVYIEAGLGNQMFQYAYYKWLRGQGLNAWLDTDYFVPFPWQKKIHERYKLAYFPLDDLRFVNLTADEYRQMLAVYEKFSENWLALWRRTKKTYLGKILARRFLRKLFNRRLVPGARYYRETKNNREFFFTGVSPKQNVVLEGFFQSYKHLNEIRPGLLKAFSFNVSRLPKLVQAIGQDLRRGNSVVVHVRRNTYVALGLALPLQYYVRAVAYLRERLPDLRFFVFSDDLDYVKTNFAFLGNYYAVDTAQIKRSDYYDLFLLSKAKHSIIANSTFSWWGAWLNQNPQKLVLVPDNWGFDIDIDTICPPEWIRISAK